MPRPTSRNVPGLDERVWIYRLRMRQVDGCRLQRLAPRRVAKPTRQAGRQLSNSRHARHERRISRVVAERHTRADEMRIRERKHLHVLAQEFVRWRLERIGQQGRPLGPPIADEFVEHRRAPVEGALWRFHLQHRRTLGREVDAGVLRVPDERDAHGGRSFDEVPPLPRDEAALRDSGRRRGDECSKCKTDCRWDDDARHVAARQSREDRECPEQNQPADDQASRRAAQRRGPPSACEEQEERRNRAPRRHRERHGEREGEDRGEQRSSHVRVDARIERSPDVVEIDDAAGEPRPDRAGQVTRV